jgi:hypothetical protein
MPLAAHHLAVNYIYIWHMYLKKAQAPAVWIPPSQAKGDDPLCFSVFTASMWVQRKSTWSAKGEKRNTLVDRHPWVVKMFKYMPPFFFVYIQNE